MPKNKYRKWDFVPVEKVEVLKYFHEYPSFMGTSVHFGGRREGWKEYGKYFQ